MALIEINNRYSKLAEDTCCLSCGGAVNYSKAANGEICLDLGSGRGTDVLRLAEEVGKTGFVYGVDISQGMLDKANRTAEKMGVTNVKFIRSELEEIPLDSETVDLVISNCTINHAKNKDQVWNEIFRILKNNGRFVVSDIYSSEPVPEQYRNDPVAVSECWAGSVTRQEYLDTLENSGFKNIQIIEESAPYPKGKIEVSSFTISGFKIKSCCCC
ncbi:MAG: methyltransferase domain-containing protein [Bacteroidales bacterium]|nr:methyltransferase domain-containing protein [Bacteroidales bacterium]